MTVLGLDLLKTALHYLRENPLYLVRLAARARRLELGIPLEALRYLAKQYVSGPKAPTGLTIEAQPPAISLGANYSYMGTAIQIRSDVLIDEVRFDEDQLRFTLRLRDLSVKAPPDSPLNQFLASLPLQKPGNLVGFLPKRPPLLADAHDDLFVLDLLKVKKLAENQRLRKVLGALAEVLSVRNVRTEDGMLVIALGVRPSGLPLALSRLR